MKTSLAACLVAVFAFAPLAAHAQTAPAKSERAMPEGSDTKAMTNKAPKSERAMASTAKTKKAKSHGSERAMPTQK